MGKQHDKHKPAMVSPNQRNQRPRSPCLIPMATVQAPACPKCNIALEPRYYFHKGCSSMSKVHESRVQPKAKPAVILACPHCKGEFSRWIDQDEDKKKKAGCKLHPTELCSWEKTKKSGKWALICGLCKSEEIKNSTTKKLPGAKRGRCSNCGVRYCLCVWLYILKQLHLEILFPPQGIKL